MENTAVETLILLGGNQGKRIEFLGEARQEISQSLGPITGLSSIYETEAWGMENAQPFLNQVIRVETNLSAFELMHTLLEIEQKLGRNRKTVTDGYADRTIDLDLLYYGVEIIQEKELIVPHPRIQDRRFTLVPLCEIAPDFVHPVLAKTQSELLQSCQDQSEVKVYHE